MYGLEIAGMDQCSFGPVPVLMVVKIIWSTVVRVCEIQLSHMSKNNENPNLVSEKQLYSSTRHQGHIYPYYLDTLIFTKILTGQI